jgi:phospholipase D3/4
MGLITLRSINWTAICAGGILHTKLIVVDGESFYVGSANMDWRSLSMVKELGVIVWRSSSLGNEALKIFETYWIGADANSVPSHWPPRLSASYNQEHPYYGFYNSTLSSFYLAVSPPPFQPSSWTSDQDAIVNTISSANNSLCMEVMDYYPTTQYMPTNMYWPPIDTALRTAAYNGVSIRFLIGLWNYTDPDMLQYLNSLNALENINVMAFLVPQMNDSAGTPPYTRVNHAKWMVSDSKVYVDTSNWSGDYFLNTGGVSMNIKSDSLRDRMQGIFERDWASPYVFALNSTQVQDLFN